MAVNLVGTTTTIVRGPSLADGSPRQAPCHRTFLAGPFRALRTVLRLLTSVRFAMALVLVLAAVVLVGTVISQAPPSVVADQPAYGRWLERARGRYGGWTDLLDRLQLFYVFHSVMFRALLGVLVASIVACTQGRWHGIWNTVFRE